MTTEDENGKKWDLSDLKTQNEIEVRLREESPWLLALSLPSTVFATTLSLNSTRQNDKLMERRKVTAHISFAVKLCVMQSKSGRKFMIEQPVGTRAWRTKLMNKLLFEKGVGKVNFDFDVFEMKSAKEREVRLARKRTSIISNSQALLKELAKYQTSGRHQHVTTREWKTTVCHMYNNEFCKTVCETIMKEKNSGVLGRLSLRPSEAKDIPGTINELTQVDPHEQERSYDPFEFFDDVTGQTLDKKMAVEARKLEMQFLRNMKVYDKVPRWMAARDGCKVITTKWRDINKRDQRNPSYRAGWSAGRSRQILDWTCLPPPLHWSPCE